MIPRRKVSSVDLRLPWHVRLTDAQYLTAALRDDLDFLRHHPDTRGVKPLVSQRIQDIQNALRDGEGW